jgi:hypothetical protein
VTVLGLIKRFEDALVIMWLFEYHDPNLLANGRSLADVLDSFPSERGVAALLADCMLKLEGGDWSYTDFYRPSRGGADPTEEEVRTFVGRCAEAGVRLEYDDGSDVMARFPASTPGSL